MSEPETPLEQHPLGHPDYDPDAFDDEPRQCRICGGDMDENEDGDDAHDRCAFDEACDKDD